MRYIIVYIILIIVLTGCEKTLEFPEQSKNIKTTVIEAIITDQPDCQKVRVSCSTSFNDSVSSYPVTHASVKITSGNGDTALFSYIDDGWYSSNNLIVVPEKQYTLLVQIDTAIYRARSSMVPVHGLDSVTYSFYKKREQRDSAYYIKLYAGYSNPEQTKYYQVHLYRNNRLITYGTNIHLISDLATRSLNGLELDQAFAQYDTVDIELYSLSPQMFNYYMIIYNNILYNAGYDLEFKTNPPIQYSPEALGYFQLSALSRKRIIIE